jgi:two-component system, OmpR family, osmolarity sensor histidine kinase EnvZ
MKRLWRGGRASLVRRLTWGVALVSLLSVVVQVLVLSLWLQSLGEQFFAGLGDQARLVRAALGAAPASQRAEVAQALSVGQVRVLAQAPAAGVAPGGPPPYRPGEFEAQAEQLRAEGIGLEVRHSGLAGALGLREASALLIFSLPVAEQRWYLVREVRPPTAALTSTVTLWLVMLGAATLGAVLWSARAIARPLADLAGQLQAQGGRLQALAERADAPRELHTVTQAFNQLVSQVSSQQRQRLQLLAGVSHDLRTPLARLRLRVETQCAEPLASELTRDLMALEHIVQQFLAYVQGQAAPTEGAVRPLRPVADTVFEVLASYDEHAVQAEVQPLPWAAPPLAVQRLLGNLVDNALAYGTAPAGGAPVRVRLAQEEQGLELQVWDQGPGMSDTEFLQAQQPFVRLGPTRPDIGHCGLGLAIVAQMAQQLGGTLHTRRDAARGFAIVLRRPLARR